jgi:diguanylate cyclase (GGDEF)-like protein
MLYCFIVSYAILRHRLMDFHVVLKKSLVYTLSVGSLTGIFIVLILVMTKYVSVFVGITSFSTTVISALITAILFAPLKNSIQFLVDKAFYKSTYNHYSIVQKITHELTSTIELRRIYGFIVDTLFETLKLKNSYLLFAKKEHFETGYIRLAKDGSSDVNDGSTPFSEKRDIKYEFDKSGQGKLLDRGSELVKLLEKNNILIKEELQEFIDKQKAKAIEDDFSRYNSEVAVPIFIDDKPAFLLMLGEKLSGFIFSTEDINMLKTIANQAAIALKNARLYDELEQRVEERTEEILEVNNNLNNEIIERMRIEVELHNIHKKLELRVEERTADLKMANKQLQLEITERKKTEEQLEHHAFHDRLTNLPNRSLFTTYLGHFNERVKQDKNYLFAVLFIDLDRFKVINDSLGHIVGDQVLIAVARKMETCIRPEDMISRFGGDEYAIFMENIKDVSDAIRIADRIQKELMSPIELDGFEVFTSASIGIALSSSDYDREEDIIRDADSAMYRAKASGRARYEIFDSKMHASSMKLLQMEVDLRRAIERNEFLVNYQPVVSMNNNRIVGAEALIRWHHPQHGLISPMEFIPLAEETGLISKIGEWILRTACAQNKAWQDMGHEPLLMKVNFSVRQFQHQNLLETVKKIIQETKMPARFLDIEITESIATEENCIKVLHEFSAMGAQISVDDFGTGYSSLGYLKNLPFNTIKIDKSFVNDISEENNAEGIVKAIIAMAHSLKMKVVAEGVEKEEQRSFLQSYHCDEMQGYLFSPPVSEKEFTKLLENARAMLLS